MEERMWQTREAEGGGGGGQERGRERERGRRMRVYILARRRERERGTRGNYERGKEWLSDARASSRFSRHVGMRARLDDDDDDDDQICSGIRNRWDGTVGWE